MFWKRRPTAPSKSPRPVQRCSFCNKSARYVPKLVTAPYANICSECVAICQDIIAEDRILEPGKTAEELEHDKHRVEAGTAALCGLCGNLIDLSGLVEVPERGRVCIPCIEVVISVKPEVVQ